MKNYTLLTMLLLQSLIVLGQNWLPVGNGTNNGYNGGIALQSYNGKLIAGGAFNQAGTVNAQGVAMWDGNDWSIVDSTMNNFFAVRPLVIYRGELYGFVESIFGPSGFMMRLDSNFKWHIVPNSDFFRGSYAGSVYTAAVYNDQLYVAGDFDSIGNASAKHIAKWNGVHWTPVGTGIDDTYILSMAVYGNELYVGGNFDVAGGLQVHHLARWNGIAWHDVDGGMDGRVIAMEVYNNELYIGGDFELAGGLSMMHITKWNSISFSDVGGGLGFAGAPDAFKVYGNRLVIGGYFSPGLFQNDAGTWDGVSFASLGTGLNAGPTGFEIYNDRLYAGGRFNGIGLANGVALLDTAGFTVSDNEMDLPDHSISISPNPFSSQTTISFETAQKNTVIRITDILGQEILSSHFSGRQFVIDRAGMQAGIYFVEIRDRTQKIIFKKIVVQ